MLLETKEYGCCKMVIIIKGLRETKIPNTHDYTHDLTAPRLRTPLHATYALTPSAARASLRPELNGSKYGRSPKLTAR
jgi:hypothetical protein